MPPAWESRYRARDPRSGPRAARDRPCARAGRELSGGSSRLAGGGARATARAGASADGRLVELAPDLCHRGVQCSPVIAATRLPHVQDAAPRVQPYFHERVAVVGDEQDPRVVRAEREAFEPGEQVPGSRPELVGDVAVPRRDGDPHAQPLPPLPRAMTRWRCASVAWAAWSHDNRS